MAHPEEKKIICDLLYETPEVCCHVGWLCVLDERKHFALGHIKSEFYMESSSMWKGILLEVFHNAELCSHFFCI